MRYDFRDAASLPAGIHTFPSRANLVQDLHGLHMWCRDGAGAGFMVEAPRQYGTWKVRMRISVGLLVPTTKVCLLLMQAKDPITGVRPWPPELDFNESGDRAWSHQTLHTAPLDPETGQHPEVHTSFPVDQTQTHTFGVTVEPDTILYTCDGHLGASTPNLVPDVLWNLHVRTEPNLDPVSETCMDVRWIEIPE